MPPRSLLIVAVVLSAGTVRADPINLVTPYSISPVPTGWITNQYQGLGLVFAAPTDSRPVGTYDWQSYSASWSPRGPHGEHLGPPIPGVPAGYQSGSFVMPGMAEPATTSSLAVQVSPGFTSVFTLTGYDLAGNLIASQQARLDPGHNAWLGLHAAGMHSFQIVSDWPPPPPTSSLVPVAPLTNSPGYAITAIEFYPVAAVPEPGGLVLSGLGAMILILVRLR